MGHIPEDLDLTLPEEDIPEQLRPSFDTLLRALREMYQDIAGAINQRNNYTVLRVEEAAYGDTYLKNGEANVWVDEAANKLKFRVKYSNGTLKTGEVALT